LREREVNIFGDTLTPSSVQLWVEQSQIETHSSKCDVKTKNGTKFKFIQQLPDYVVFPFDYKKHEPEILFAYGFRFKLHIRFASGNEQLFKEEIEPALWAWINFGGIGARTRRGCGSLYCKDFSPSPGEDLFQWFSHCQQVYKLHLPEGENFREWPVLRNVIRIKTQSMPISQAWKTVIEVYRNFRKDKYRDNGRSNWPEPDSIREITGMSDPRHRESRTLANKSEFAFPRAQLGLPIQFHFANKTNRFGDLRDPYRTELVPTDKDRLASPLIVKALAVTPQTGHSVVVTLSQPRLQTLRLRLNPEDKGNVERNHEHIEKVRSKLESVSITQQNIYVTPRYKSNGVKNPMKVGPGQSKETKSAVEAFLRSEEVWKWRPNVKS
jgi:CRISPR-associated protein Cmr1